MIHQETIILLIGFIIGYFLYSFFKFRSGGVLAMPLLAIYTLNYPLMLPFTIFTVIILFVIMLFMFNKIIIYGRRLLYVSLGFGMILTFIFSYLMKIDVGWYPLLVPGLLAYNIHREVNSKGNLHYSIIMNILYFVLMMVITILINFWFFI
jgi:hypothetical protein